MVKNNNKKKTPDSLVSLCALCIIFSQDQIVLILHTVHSDYDVNMI